jgi:hypothetical protein
MVQQNFFNEFPAPERVYRLKGEGSIAASNLAQAESGLQKEVMAVWFRAHFEDPDNSCPYDSREGGYQYIYGGPFDAREELEVEFSGIVSDEAIEELTEELESECVEWSGDSSVTTDELTEWDYEPSVQIPKHLQTLNDSIATAEALLAVEVPPGQQRQFRGMLYVSVITALEAYLLDNFLSRLRTDKALFRKFIETTDHFRQQKIPVSSIFAESDGIEKRGEAYLVKMLWHRLSDVAKLYKNTLGVQFPEDMTVLSEAVKIRHDLVHRNGHTTDDNDLTTAKIDELVKLVRDLVDGIERQPKTK